MTTTSRPPSSSRSGSLQAGGPDPHAWLADHGDYLYAVAMKQVGNPEVAEDLVQETLLAAIERSNEFAGRSTLRTWLCGILRHKGLDHLRRAGRAPSVSLELLDGDIVDVQFTNRGKWKQRPGKWNAGPTDAAESDELREAMRTCLAKLPDRSADALLMLERQEMSLETVGEVLGQSSSHVAVILYRARTAIRRCLERNWFRKGIS